VNDLNDSIDGDRWTCLSASDNVLSLSHNSLDHRYMTNTQSHEPKAGDDGDERDGVELVRMEEIKV